MNDAEARYRISAQDRSKRAWRSFRKNTTAADKAVGLLKGRIVSLVGGAALGLLVKQATDAGDRIQKMSIALSVSTQALSQYRHATQIAGTDLETLGKGIKQMERQVSDASRGLGEGRDALKLLGLEAKGLMTLQPEAMFERLADAIASVENPADRTGAAMDLFGRAGVDLIPLMADGAAGIKKLRDEADDLGLTLTRLEANQLAETNDAMQRIKSAGTSVGQSLALLAAGPIQSVAGGLVKLVGEIRGMVKEATSSTMDKAIDRMEDLGKNIQYIKQLTAIRDLVKVQGQLSGTSESLTDVLGNLADMTNRVNTETRESARWINDGTAAASRWGTAVNEAAMSENLMIIASMKSTQSMKAEAKALDEAEASAAALRGTFDDVGVDVDKLTSGVRELALVQDPFNTDNIATASGLLEQVDAAQTAITLGLLKGELDGGAWETATERLDRYKANLELYRERLEVIIELEAKRKQLIEDSRGVSPIVLPDAEGKRPGEDKTGIDGAIAGAGALSEGLGDPTDRFDQLIDAMASTREEADLLRQGFMALNEFGGQAIESFIDASVAAVHGSKKAYGEMGKVLLKWTADTIKALAMQAASKALFYTAEGLAWMSLGKVNNAGLAFGAAKMYGVMAGYAGATAIALGAASANNAPSGQFLSQTERENTTGLADASSGSSGSRSVNSSQLAQAANTIHVTHVYYGTVYFGSQTEATTESVQAAVGGAEEVA